MEKRNLVKTIEDQKEQKTLNLLTLSVDDRLPARSCDLLPKLRLEVKEFRFADFSWDERSRLHLRTCPRDLISAMKYLADKYKYQEYHIHRVALRLGVNELRMRYQREMDKLVQLRSEVHKTGARWILDFFDKASFDFKTNRTKKLNHWFPWKDIDACNGIGQQTGLTQTDVSKIAIASGLLLAEELTPSDNAYVFDVVKRFHKWVLARVERAEELTKLARKLKENPNCKALKTWNDVYAE